MRIPKMFHVGLIASLALGVFLFYPRHSKVDFFKQASHTFVYLNNSESWGVMMENKCGNLAFSEEKGGSLVATVSNETRVCFGRGCHLGQAMDVPPGATKRILLKIKNAKIQETCIQHPYGESCMSSSSDHKNPAVITCDVEE